MAGIRPASYSGYYAAGYRRFEVCTTLRTEFPDMGIIMLTARDLDMDRIRDWSMGQMIMWLSPSTPELVLRAKPS